MTMGDHGEVSSSSSTTTNTSSSPYRSVQPNSQQPKYPYGHVTRGANKMLASYTLPGQVMRSNAVSTTTANGHHHHLQTGLMQPPSSFTVLTGLHHLNNNNNNNNGGSPSDDHSLPSSDIGEVDLDLWDLDINGPSVSPQSSTGGGHSPAVPPGRRSSDTSSTSGFLFFFFFCCCPLHFFFFYFPRRGGKEEPFLLLFLSIYGPCYILLSGSSIRSGLPVDVEREMRFVRCYISHSPLQQNG